ncbi:dockerin type I repeat-containing protein [Nodularia spumigena]|uniref:dockerin type I repeat-containing protein n=1 Tax=Nodularia spumigena TaxID=70799 RepID=UPI002B1ECD5F|nr:dockerin type I repeat-containing protein [Nodularia spumigena]MEA5557581.1 dockerin type I repeat-containing protein [Nodularia spumigena CH309]
MINTTSCLSRAALALSLIQCVALTAHAQLHNSDIILTIEQDRIITNTIIEDTITPARVWSSSFASFNFTDSPGFDTPTGTFSPSIQIGVNVLRALRLWNGDAFPMDASGIPAERIQLRKLPFGSILTPTTDTFTPGFGIPTGSGGSFHQHMGFTLQAPASAGIYLMEFEIWTTQPGVQTSETTWVVFNQNSPLDEVDEAVDWVYANLITTPCPGDVNGDGLVDILDFLDFIGAFSACDGQPAPCDVNGISADFNDDGFVDVLDLLDFLNAFGQSCN